MKTTIRLSVATVAALGLTSGSLALAAPAFAHTPEVTTTCTTITAHLTNYDVREGTPDTVTVVVIPAVPRTPAVYGPAPLLTPATPGSPAVPAVLEYEYAQKITGKTKWEREGWNPGKGWDATGNTREVTPAVPGVPATDAVYGEPPLITPAVDGTPERTEEVVVPGTPGEDNTITLTLDGVVTDVIHFGHSFDGTKQIDGTAGHAYTVAIDAIGTAYDRTFTGTTTKCIVPPVEPPTEEPPVVVPPVEPPVVVPPVVTPPTTPPVVDVPPVVAPPTVTPTPDLPPVTTQQRVATGELLASTGTTESDTFRNILAAVGAAALVVFGAGLVALRRITRPRYSRKA